MFVVAALVDDLEVKMSIETHKSDFRSTSKCDSKQAEIIGVFRFPWLQIGFDQSCCWGKGSVDACNMEWV